MNPFVLNLLGKKASEIHPAYKINCFNTVVSYFKNQLDDGKISAQAMLDWLQAHTEQISESDRDIETIVVLWSSTDPSISPEIIQIADLKREAAGYPFGLVMEHAAIFVTPTDVFQKASPSDEHKFEIVEFSRMIIQDYSHTPWLKTTLHKMKS